MILDVLNVNDPPEINYYIKRQYFIINRDNLIKIPSDCIIDPDLGDSLIYTLSLENNSALPGWLNFDPVTLNLTGNPPNNAVGIYSLKLTAADRNKSKQWIVFELEVTLPTATSTDLENQKFTVNPNPAETYIWVNVPFGKDVGQISITNLEGQILKTFVRSAGNQFKIPLTEMRQGVYFITLRQGVHMQAVKFIKK